MSAIRHLNNDKRRGLLGFLSQLLRYILSTLSVLITLTENYSYAAYFLFHAQFIRPQLPQRKRASNWVK